MKRLSILLLMLIAIMTAKAQTSSWNTNVTWTPSFRTNAGATEVRFALGGTKPYFNLSDSLNMIRNSFSNYYTKAQSDAKYIFANPSTPQTANIYLSGSIKSDVNIPGDNAFLYFKNNNSAGSSNLILEAGGNPAFIYNTGPTYEETLGVDGTNSLILWNYNEAVNSKISFRVNGNGIAEDLLSINKGGSLTIGVQPTLSTGNNYSLTIDSVSGDIKRQKITGGSGSAGVSSFNSRTGAVTPQSADYDPFYPLLVGTYNNPTWINTLAYSKITGVPSFITTETDPTVPAYAKTLTAFSVIKTSTDALYEPIFSKNTAFNKNFGTASGTIAEGNDSRILNGQTAFGWGNHASAGYQLVSNLQTTLTASSTKYPNVDAVNTGLAAKANLLGGNAFTGVQKTDQYWATLVPSTGTQEVSKVSLALNSGAGRAVGTLFLNTTSLDGTTAITTGILQAPAAQTANWIWILPNKTGTLATLTDITTLPTLTAGSVVFSDGTTLAQDNTNFFWNNTNKRLGIGTNTPQTPLQVMHTPSGFVGAQFVGNSPSTSLIDDYPALAIINTNTTANNYAGIDFFDSSTPASQWASAGIKAIWTTHGTSNATSRADLAFVTNGADGFNTRLRITSAGLLNVPGLTASSMLKTDASKNIAVAVSNTDYLPVASPAMTGTPVAPTPGTNINTTQIPTTAWTNTYYAAKASPALTGTPTSTTATAKTNTTQIATTAFVSKQFTATGSGTGAATTITVAHGITGVTSANSVIVFPNNAAAAGISYATMDATNVSIVYTVAPASGTNNLSYSISIK